MIKKYATEIFVGIMTFIAIIAGGHVSIKETTDGVGGPIIAPVASEPLIDTGDSYDEEKPSEVPNSGNIKTEITKDIPQVSLNKWDGEVSLGATFVDPSLEAHDLVNGKVKWDSPEKTVSAYQIEKSQKMIDGGLEFDITLHSKPDTNVFDFQLDNYENLDFYKQLPLNQEPLSGEGLDMCTETDCFNTKGQVIKHRDVDVLYSYAVYYKGHKDQKGSGKNYATGKAYHIYRPKVTDALGAIVWGDMNILNGVMTITVPQKFLNTATYPVVVDPTFGYTTIGGTTENFTSFLHCTKATPSDTATMTKFTTYASSASKNIGVAFYDNSTTIPGTKLAEDSGNTLVTSAGWYDNNISASFTASTVYWLCNWQDGTVTYYYDSAAAGTAIDKGSVTFETWPSPMSSVTDTLSKIYSVYATYSTTASVAPQVIMFN